MATQKEPKEKAATHLGRVLASLRQLAKVSGLTEAQLAASEGAIQSEVARTFSYLRSAAPVSLDAASGEPRASVEPSNDLDPDTLP